MATKVEIAVQGLEEPECLQRKFEAALSERIYSSSRVAVAYATVAGVRDLLATMPNGSPRQSQWLLGLDDHFTQPGAIKLVRGLRNSEVRVVRSPVGSRFHPKVYYFRSSAEPATAIFVVGSANLTRAALRHNCEAVSILTTDDKARRSSFAKTWTALWDGGEQLTEEIFEEYSNAYRARRPATRRPIDLPEASSQQILERDDAEIDPASAEICWIECGSVTARGRELEFKAEQALYFDLQPGGGRTSNFRFALSDGNETSLNMKYQENHMWRLQMNNAVPEVRLGLRPSLEGGGQGRSELVAVFHRTATARTFALSFLHLESPEFLALRARSAELGTLGRTTTREYGWC